MTTAFAYDVFLSYSARDKAVVRALAGRAPRGGLKVWFDGRVLKPGDNMQTRIEEGLDRSGVLARPAATPAQRRMLRVSANAFGFPGPWGKQSRFIPCRLSDVCTKGSLTQSLYAKWLSTGCCPRPFAPTGGSDAENPLRGFGPRDQGNRPS